MNGVNYTASSIFEKYLLENFYVTPEMFGAIGDGVVDDTEAFEHMTSQSSKIIIPDKTYNLSNPVFSDQESVICNRGTYNNANFIVNSIVSHTTPHN